MSGWKIIPGIYSYFATSTIIEWQYVFTSDNCFQIIIDGLKYCMAHKGLRLHAYVIMPNHVHYILSSEENKNLSDIMRDLNAHSSKEITRNLEEDRRFSLLKIFAHAAGVEGRGNKYKVWEEGFHPIALETEPFIQEKMDYLHDNPVRKGYVERAEHWKYSSARNYMLDDHSVIKVDCLF